MSCYDVSNKVNTVQRRKKPPHPSVYDPLLSGTGRWRNVACVDCEYVKPVGTEGTFW